MNKSRAATDQKLIAELVKEINFGFITTDHEFGTGDNIPELVRHDGYTYSIRSGDKKITMKFEVEDV